MQVFMRTAFSAAAIAALSISFAQAQQTLEPVIVSANPLGADINDLITPVSVLRGDQFMGGDFIRLNFACPQINLLKAIDIIEKVVHATD